MLEMFSWKMFLFKRKMTMESTRREAGLKKKIFLIGSGVENSPIKVIRSPEFYRE